MTDPLLIGPVGRTTPATSSWLGKERPIPRDLLRDASRRLGILCLVASGLWTVGSVLWHLAVGSMGAEAQWLGLGMPDAIAAVSVAVSMLLFWYTRDGERDPRAILDLGLAYMVFTAFALGLMIHWQPPPVHRTILPEISWIGAVVLMFAAMVPSTPMKMFAAGLVAVTMNPVGMLIARARGSWSFEPATALLMHYPDYLLLGVAVIIAHVVTTLGRQVAKARELGSYRLGDLLGRGGMGEVYKATHRMLARPAAIKLIRPEMIGATGSAGAQLAITRFWREAEAAASLRSPHTVELYDFGVTEDQTLYFVMELLDGMDLESVVRQHGPLPPGRVVHILRQACASLEEAHARGLVHRDIKPANIHLGRLGLVPDFVKVLDFGLVKAAHRNADEAMTTQAGLIIGTPGYMAPEIALGEDVDRRADLYGIGCVAYYLLTGEPVFSGDTAMQVMAKHLHATPPAPSALARFPTPPDLDELVLACLAKNPAERPQSAADVVRLLASCDVEPWTDEQADEWWSSAQEKTAATPPVDRLSQRLSGASLPTVAAESDPWLARR